MIPAQRLAALLSLALLAGAQRPGAGLGNPAIMPLPASFVLPGERAPLEPPLPSLFDQPIAPTAAGGRGRKLWVAAPPGASGAAAPAGDGSEARPFATIAAALAAAPDFALIQLAEGDYAETVVLDRALVLQGRGAFRTRLVAQARSRWPAQPAVPLITLRGPGLAEVRALALEGGAVGVDAIGEAEPKPGEPWRDPGKGPAHRLVEVALRGQYQAGLRVRGARVSYTGGELVDIGLGRAGLGIEGAGARLELRGLVLRRAGHRGLELTGTQALLEDLDSSTAPSGTAAVQVLDGSRVTARGGSYSGQRGSAFFVGNAFLRLEGVRLERDEYGVLGARGARIELEGGEVLDMKVAGLALVNSTVRVRGTHLARGGTEAAISALQSTATVLIEDAQIDEPGVNGVHLTRASLVLRRSRISGAVRDHQGDFGDGIYAAESDLLLDGSTLIGNAGTGATLLRSALQLEGTLLSANGRAGVWLTDRSALRAMGNRFDGNRSGVELGELSSASLGGNTFTGNKEFAIDGLCGQSTVLELLQGNVFGAGKVRRSCP